MHSARLHHGAAHCRVESTNLVGVGVIKRKDVETLVNCKIQVCRLFSSSVRFIPITSVLMSRKSKTFSALVDGHHKLLSQRFI